MSHRCEEVTLLALLASQGELRQEMARPMNHRAANHPRQLRFREELLLD
jgi:hypothetical protein